jgi:hypothetical protein
MNSEGKREKGAKYGFSCRIRLNQPATCSLSRCQNTKTCAIRWKMMRKGLVSSS